MAERDDNAPLARTTAGDLRGRWDGELAVFRGVPFSAAPVGELRFAAPRRHPGWTGIRDAGEFGPCATQPASRLEAVMGRVDFKQSEDCLTLSVWAPPACDGPYPVLLWIHGGGFATGSGSWAFYSGQELARNGRVVVVTANYRLGALGYLFVPELANNAAGAANRGLLDQVAALNWVYENIAAFGGDPEAITIAGQSAGGAAIAAMMTDRDSRWLFKRAILQSPVLGPPTSLDEAAAITDHLLKVLGIARGQIAELRSVTIDHLLAAQIQTSKKFARFGAPVGAIQQVADGAVITDQRAGRFESVQTGLKPGDELIGQPRDAAGTGMAVLAGTTRDEMDAFLMQEHVRYTSRQPMIRMLEEAGLAKSVFDDYAAVLPGRSPAKIASAILTDQHFRIPTLRFLSEWSGNKGLAYLYRFDWQPRPDSRYGACHCIDVPFAMNNLGDWHSAPVPPAMLDGNKQSEFDALAQAFQRAWIAFIWSGNPGHDGLPSWVECNASNLNSMQFDVDTRMAMNPDDHIRDLWNSSEQLW
jgi:para-nitrobenzyl esterase